MKFKLNLHQNADTSTKRSSVSSSSKRPKREITTVESWNQLRTIGSEAKQPKALENVLNGYDYDVTLQEVQDWDYYIAEFNEQYRHQMKHPVAEEDKDSISTIANSKSQLLSSRHRRMRVYRICFILTCLILWGICFGGAFLWYLTYLIYPIGFLQELETSVVFKYFTPDAIWYAFLLNAHGWFVGCFGLLCAFCFRESPGVLKQFILRVPYMLLVPSLLIFVAVRFVGTFSSQKLKIALNKKIPEYYNVYDEKDKNFNVALTGKRLWDQLQKILKCCGVEGASDWDSIDNDLTDDISFWPTTCCPKEFVRRTWDKERPHKDDCFFKINKAEGTDEYEWAYPEGCLHLAYEFFVKQGAFVVGIMVGNFCALCLCLVFAFKYYTSIKKCEELRFKYSWKQWFAEIFFLSHCAWLIPCCKKCCSACKNKKQQKPQGPDPKFKNKSFASGHLSQASADSAASLAKIPSVIITAPKEGSEKDEEGNNEQADGSEKQQRSSLDDDTENIFKSLPSNEPETSISVVDET